MGFVSGAKDKASGNSPATKDVAYKDNKFIAIMNKYWKSKSLDEHTWGEQMIKAAFEGTKVGTNTHLDFSTVGRDFRKEAIQKGIVYTNIFPYVIWEVQDAENDCLALAGTNNDDKSVHAWDEAVAFYAGSKTRGKGYGILESEAGKLQYRLADKRCKNFKTCANGFSGTSKVNQDIFALFNLGKEEGRKMATSASTADCAELNNLKEKITTLSLVPFVPSTRRGTMIPAGARNKLASFGPSRLRSYPSWPKPTQTLLRCSTDVHGSWTSPQIRTKKSKVRWRPLTQNLAPVLVLDLLRVKPLVISMVATRMTRCFQPVRAIRPLLHQRTKWTLDSLRALVSLPSCSSSAQLQCAS